MASINSLDEFVDLLGVRLVNCTIERAVRHIIDTAVADRGAKVFFLNAHCVNVMRRDVEYAEVLRKSDACVYGDGAGVGFAAALSGRRLQDNVNGTDAFPLICSEADRCGVPIGLVGAKPGVADQCAANLKRAYRNLHVVYVAHGYDVDAEKIIRGVREAGARIVFVAMGVPLQEKFIDDVWTKESGVVWLGVGALLDFCAGEVVRAPAVFRKMKLEWFFRLLQEPRRLFGRYVFGVPIFLFRVLALRIQGAQRLRIGLRNEE